MNHIYLKRTASRGEKMQRIARIIGDDSDTSIIDFALNFTLASHAPPESMRCLGYVHIAIPGDVAVCVQCGAEDAPLVALMESGAMYGPLCIACVEAANNEL